jgi:hypothetical protein
MSEPSEAAEPAETSEPDDSDSLLCQGRIAICAFSIDSARLTTLTNLR